MPASFIDEFGYDYDELQDVDFEGIIEDAMECIIIPELTGLDEVGSVDRFEKILGNLEKKFNEENGLNDEEEEEENPGYGTVRLDIELYKNEDCTFVWYVDCR